MTLSAAKIAELEGYQTGIARRVLNAVPVAEAWTTHQIGGELKRVGHHVQMHMLSGVLLSLMESGLVRCHDGGETYTRVVARPKLVLPEKQLQGEVLAAIATVTAPARSSLLDRMADIATELRILAQRAEDLALEAETEMQGLRSQAQKARELRDLLRSME